MALKHLYLIHGDEDYLKDQEKAKIEKAIEGLGGFVDKHVYSKRSIKGSELVGLANAGATLFGGPRCILLEDCKVEEPDDWIDFLPNLENTVSYIIVMEKDIDKRLKIYKSYKKYGEDIEFKVDKAEKQMSFVKNWIKENGVTMKDSDLGYFLTKVPDQLYAVEQELIKLKYYKAEIDAEGNVAGTSVVINREDVDALTTISVEDRIFDMIAAAINGDANKAYILFHDLLSLKESPVKVLTLMTNQLNSLLQIKDLDRLKVPASEIAKTAKLHPFVVKSNLGLAKKMSYGQLKGLFEKGVELTAASRTGTGIDDKMAVELMISECLRMNKA